MSNAIQGGASRRFPEILHPLSTQPILTIFHRPRTDSFQNGPHPLSSYTTAPPFHGPLPSFQKNSPSIFQPLETDRAIRFHSKEESAGGEMDWGTYKFPVPMSYPHCPPFLFPFMKSMGHTV